MIHPTRLLAALVAVTSLTFTAAAGPRGSCANSAGACRDVSCTLGPGKNGTCKLVSNILCPCVCRVKPPKKKSCSLLAVCVLEGPAPGQWPPPSGVPFDIPLFLDPFLVDEVLVEFGDCVGTGGGETSVQVDGGNLILECVRRPFPEDHIIDVVANNALAQAQSFNLPGGTPLGPTTVLYEPMQGVINLNENLFEWSGFAEAHNDLFNGDNPLIVDVIQGGGLFFNPGTFTLTFELVEVSIATPRGCLADHNDDCTVNTSDLLDFLNDWNQQSPAGDFNHDGLYNTADVLAFLQVFSLAQQGGCP